MTRTVPRATIIGIVAPTCDACGQHIRKGTGHAMNQYIYCDNCWTPMTQKVHRNRKENNNDYIPVKRRW